jgi:D-alanyl-D-alanine carboxypeptidase
VKQERRAAKRCRSAAVAVALTLVVSVVAVSASPSIEATASAAKPKTFNASTIRAIDAIVNAAKNGAGVPGMVVGIWDPKRGTLVKGYGAADVTQPQTTIAADDHFRIASITKSFTATAILQLVAAKKLSLDAHLSEFVPDIANGDAITVAQLLEMTAGVYSYTEDDTFVSNYFANPQMPFTAQDALTIVRAHQPDFAPGTDIHYSDSNYVLLQLIAEKVTGQPLGNIIQSHILDKVGLDATSYPTTDTMPDPFSHGYLEQPIGGPRDVTLSNPGVAGGAGAMISSLEDLHTWAVALGTGALLPYSLQQQRLQTGTLVTTPTIKFSYGMGITNVNGFLGHDGGILGYATAMFYLPEAKATIVVESNSDNVSAQSALWTFIGIASYLYPKQFPNGL